MGVDLDIAETIKNLKTSKPPFKCVVDKCDKQYRSIIGIQYHLSNYDHETATPLSPVVTTPSSRGRSRGRSRVSGTKAQPFNRDSPREAFTYNEAEQTVYFDIDGHSLSLNINDELPIVSSDEYQKMVENGDCPPAVDIPPEPHIKLPEASVNEIKNYFICDAPPRPNAYIRFIEKTAEELDGEVEYDVDEEDTTWLGIINEKRTEQGIAPVSVDSLELLMDRLEKESYFQVKTSLLITLSN